MKNPMPVLRVLLLPIAMLGAADLPVAPVLPPTETLAFPNGGFESSADGWDTLPPNAEVVTDSHTEGEHGARLTVTDPLKEAVYITRKIPVVGGARYRFTCRVKTEKVEATAGKKAPIGAGLIVEWADTKGSWYAAGLVQCGLFGTRDWTEKVCDDLRAPEEAGYALIFLAVRGSGTAWFDDLRAVRVLHYLKPLEPAAEAVLGENRPAFTWAEEVRASRFDLELSPVVDFSKGRLAYEGVSSPFRPPETLQPGTWFWRLSAPGLDSPPARRMKLTAPENAPTTAPLLKKSLFRLTTTAQPLSIPLTGAVAGWAVKAWGDGKVLPSAFVSGGEQLTVSPEGGWRKGLQGLEVVFHNGQGITATHHVDLLVMEVPAVPVAIDAVGRYTAGGKPIFPLGIYQVSTNAMAKVKAGGFDLIHSYQWEGEPDPGAPRSYLDAAHRSGLRAWIGFDRGKRSGQGMVQGNRGALMARVAALADHPGLFCWYLFDEPELADQYLSPRMLTEYAELVRTLDPYHPVVVSTWGPRMNQYRPSWDSHWTQAYEKPAGVLKELILHEKLTGGKSPLTLLLHIYDKEQSPRFKVGGKFEPARFLPDGPWMDGAVFTGLTRNVNGLFWWMLNDGGKNYLTVDKVPGAWESLTNLTHRLRSLSSILVDGVPFSPLVIPGSDKNLVVAAKVVAGIRTVVAVNLGEAPIGAPVPWSGVGKVTAVGENRAVKPEDMKDETLGRFGVHVYQGPTGP